MNTIGEEVNKSMSIDIEGRLFPIKSGTLEEYKKLEDKYRQSHRVSTDIPREALIAFWVAAGHLNDDTELIKGIEKAEVLV